MEAFSRTKNSEVYREQLATSLEEKQSSMRKLVETGNLPRIDGGYRVLELGTGGGETLELLQANLGRRKDIQFIGVDVVQEFAKHTLKRGINAVVADAGKLPFADSSISAINASALFHEIFSYGVTNSPGERVLGIDAVRMAVHECERILAPGGALVYRDIATPESDELSEVIYRSPAICKFIQWWLPRFASSKTHGFSELTNGLKTKETENALVIDAHRLLHREIQRHFVTFRDLVRRVAFPKLHIDILDESWVDLEGGVKRHSLLLDKGLNRSAPEELPLESPDYDKFTDEIIIEHWGQIVSWVGIEWMEREGNERYTSLALTDFTSLVNESSGGNMILDKDSAQLVTRHYYMRYLKEWCSNPEFEGKQVAVFRKVS